MVNFAPVRGEAAPTDGGAEVTGISQHRTDAKDADGLCVATAELSKAFDYTAQ
jgi:hypothetical protein